MSVSSRPTLNAFLPTWADISSAQHSMNLASTMASSSSTSFRLTAEPNTNSPKHKHLALAQSALMILLRTLAVALKDQIALC